MNLVSGNKLKYKDGRFVVLCCEAFITLLSLPKFQGSELCKDKTFTSMIFNQLQGNHRAANLGIQ